MNAQTPEEATAQAVKLIAALLVALVVAAGLFAWGVHVHAAQAHKADCIERLSGPVGNDCPPGSY